MKVDVEITYKSGFTVDVGDLSLPLANDFLVALVKGRIGSWGAADLGEEVQVTEVLVKKSEGGE